LRLARDPAPEKAWAKLQKLQAANPGLPARTLNALKQRVQQKPNDGPAWFDLGLLHIVSSDPKQAMTAFANAARYQPQDPYAHAYQGFAMVEAGAPKSAMGPLQTALKLDPRHRFAKWVLAQAHYRQRDRHQAAKLLNPPSTAIRTTTEPS
jgi:cytochrome c-type biogenesis protein CcmH/NrfG